MESNKIEWGLFGDFLYLTSFLLVLIFIGISIGSLADTVHSDEAEAEDIEFNIENYLQ